MSDDGIEYSIEVRGDRARAFRIWTGHIDLWWPKVGHTRSGVIETTICMEPEIGGRLFERTADGREIQWGEVQVWEPPERIVHTWLMGTDESHPTIVDVTFAAGSPGATQIVVRQRSGRMEKPVWRRSCGGFERAWAEVLRAYCDAADNTGRER